MSIHTYFRIYNLDPTISLSRLSLSPLVFLPLAASIKADSHYKFVCNGCITFNSFTDIFEWSASCHMTWNISSSENANQSQVSSQMDKDKRKFFDIDYIFSDPIPSKNRSNSGNGNSTTMRISPFKRHKAFFDSETTNQS